MERIFLLLGKFECCRSAIGRGEGFWVFPIGFQQGKEAGLRNARRFLEISPSDLALTAALKQYFDLLIRLSSKKEQSIPPGDSLWGSHQFTFDVQITKKYFPIRKGVSVICYYT